MRVQIILMFIMIRHKQLFNCLLLVLHLLLLKTHVITLDGRTVTRNCRFFTADSRTLIIMELNYKLTDEKVFVQSSYR